MLLETIEEKEQEEGGVYTGDSKGSEEIERIVRALKVT